MNAVAVRLFGLILLALLACRRHRFPRPITLSGLLAGLCLVLWPLTWDDVRWDDAVRVRNNRLISMDPTNAERAVASLAPDIRGAQECVQSSQTLCRFRNGMSVES
jgi:hypothetical protein